MLALQGYYDGNMVRTLEKIHAKKNQKLIITVLDEFMDESDSKDEKKSARGILAQYADLGLREKEQYAWEKAVTEKHGSAYANVILRYLLNDNEARRWYQLTHKQKEES